MHNSDGDELERNEHSCAGASGSDDGECCGYVGGVVSNAVSFTVTVPAPSITSLNPASGLVGAS